MKTISTRLLQLALVVAAVFFLTSDASANTIKWFSFKKKKKIESADYTFRLHCPDKNLMKIDSALIILDKYDFTGAGVVMQVVAVDSNHHLNLKDIPVGKYYAGIHTYGLNRQYLSVVITVTGDPQDKKTNSIRIKVAEADAYIHGQAEIPAEDLRLFSFVRSAKQAKKH